MFEQEKLANLAGAGKKQALRVTFDSRLRLEFHGSQVTSDAGLLAYRELDEALGLTAPAEELLSDWRTGQNTQRSMSAMLRQSLYSRLTTLREKLIKIGAKGGAPFKEGGLPDGGGSGAARVVPGHSGRD